MFQLSLWSCICVPLIIKCYFCIECQPLIYLYFQSGYFSDFLLPCAKWECLQWVGFFSSMIHEAEVPMFQLSSWSCIYVPLIIKCYFLYRMLTTDAWSRLIVLCCICFVCKAWIKCYFSYRISTTNSWARPIDYDASVLFDMLWGCV